MLPSIDGAPNYESGGQEFESLRARQNGSIFGHKSVMGHIAMQNEKFCMASAWLCANLLPFAETRL